MQNYLIDHWMGRLGYGLTLFANLLGISFLAASLEIEDWSFWVANIALGGLIVLLIWQIVGGVRCAATLHRDGDNAWGVYLGLFVAIGLMGLQILDVVADRYFVEPRAKTIFGDDDFSVKLRGDTVYLGGEVNYLMYHALLIILSKQKHVKVVSLESHGGIVFAGRTIRKLVEEKGLATRVDTYCYSVCTLVFAAGKTRVLQDGAEIGFHGYSFDIPSRHQTVNPLEEQKKDQAYLMGRGIDAELLKRAFETDAKTLWKPTRAELYDAGFITEP